MVLPLCFDVSIIFGQYNTKIHITLYKKIRIHICVQASAENSITSRLVVLREGGSWRFVGFEPKTPFFVCALKMESISTVRI